MEPHYIEMLIRDYDQLLPLPREVYQKVIPKLKLVHHKRGTLLKKSGQIDRVSRYLCKGFIGIFSPIEDSLNLFSIFKSSDTAFDLFSYGMGKASENELRTLSDVTFLEFSQDSEKDLLSVDFHLLQLAHKITLRVIARHARSLEISKMGIRKGYSVLMKEYPGLEAELTNADLGGFFRVTKRTAERVKHSLKELGNEWR